MSEHWNKFIHRYLLGYASTIKGMQVVAAAGCAVLLYQLVRQLVRGRRRPALIAAWLYMLSPHMAFFSIRLWSEVLYGTLLLAILLFIGVARRWACEPGYRRLIAGGLALGLMAGCCVLFRGVATYMLPIFAIGLLWGRWRRMRSCSSTERRLWQRVTSVTASSWSCPAGRSAKACSRNQC